jgi:hypothetical protein
MNRKISRFAAPAFVGLATLAGAGQAFADAAAAAGAVPPCEYCAGPFADPRESPFAHREYIEDVAPYRVTRTNGKQSITSLEGATIELRAAPAVTAEWLQQYVNQHLAHVSSMPPPDMSWCPLTVPGATAVVTSTGDGFAITVMSKDRDTAKEILRRAQSLLGR